MSDNTSYAPYPGMERDVKEFERRLRKIPPTRTGFEVRSRTVIKVVIVGYLTIGFVKAIDPVAAYFMKRLLAPAERWTEEMNRKAAERDGAWKEATAVSAMSAEQIAELQRRIREDEPFAVIASELGLTEKNVMDMFAWIGKETQHKAG